MKICFISDTHNQHNDVKIPKSDVLIHCGDSTGSGRIDEILYFLDWFHAQKAQHKIFIAGNHDFGYTRDDVKSRIPKEITYLENSEIVIDGVKIWGSPYTPTFYDWAFMKNRGRELKANWKEIPRDVDVLVTHGPPFGILDPINVGCQDLLDLYTEKKIKPKVHAFGHLHEGYGIKTINTIKFVNCSILNDEYQIAHKPIVLNISN